MMYAIELGIEDEGGSAFIVPEAIDNEALEIKLLCVTRSGLCIRHIGDLTLVV